MVPARALAMCFVLFLAGCTGPGPAADKARETGLVPAGNASDAANHTAWGTLSMSAHGAGGDFVVAYQALPGNPTELSWSVDFHAEAHGASGGPVNLFAWPPALVDHFASGAEAGNAPFKDHDFVHADSGTATSDYTLQAGSGIFGEGAYFSGVLFGVTADGPWNATWTFDIGDGPTVQPSLILNGTGATLHYGSDRLAGIPKAPAGQMTLDADIKEPGWTHLELVRDALEPNTIRDYEITLPNGHAYNGIGEQQGYWVVVMGSSGSNTFDAVGSLRDAAGHLHAKVTYAETDLGEELAYAHMPYDPSRLPDEIGGGNYTAFNWPFPPGL